MSKNLLIQEPPLQVLPSLAKLIGLNESIVIQQLHYWIENKNTGMEIKGFKWVYNTYENWQEDNFPFWSVPTIQRIFSGLEKDGLIISNQFDKNGYDRKKYYRIDYEELNHRTYQVDTIEDINVTPSLNESETTTETTTESSFSSAKTNLTKDDQKKVLRKSDLGWSLQMGEKISQENQDSNILAKEAQDAFERDMNFNPLPWDSTKSWENMTKFVLREYPKDNLIFAKYRTWQRDDKGKYLALSNSRIKAKPDDFIACWPDFLAHSQMYASQMPKEGGEVVDDGNIYIG